MKYVDFNRVVIKNFLSVGETPVDVNFNTGLNIITGNNKDKVDRRNGVGKSTVADAVYFAIFGTTLRELKKDHIVNNITQKGCEITLEFTVNDDGNTSRYKINRKLTPSKCYLYKDDVDITRDSIQNTSEYIMDLLNTNPDVFQNCVIMTINNATPFMAKKKLEKRKFIEGIFNLKVFSDMLTKARQEYNQVVRELDVECAKYEEISTSLNTQIEQKQSREEDKKRSLMKLNAREETNNKKIDEIKAALKDYVEIDVTEQKNKIDKIDQTIDQIDVKIQNINNKKTECETLISVNNKKINKLNTDEAVCPVCLSKIDSNHKHYVDEQRASLSDEVDKLKQGTVKYDQKLAEAREILTVLNKKKKQHTQTINDAVVQKQNVKNLKERLEQHVSTRDDIQDDIKSLDKQDTSLDSIIKEYETRLKATQDSINSVKKQMNRLDIIKFVVSEEGVKSYIVKKILQLFNSKLAHYLKKMDSNCICVFNEYFEEEIINEKGKPCSYFNFSGAERKNIDLACLFAFMDIRRMQGDVAFNFSMYDELFDSSLDERGVELVIDILKERIEKHNECVMVISHRKESTKLATGEIIFLEKQNGVTVRVETPESELK